MDEGRIVFIGHEPCPACGSRDNLARYSDGHGYCFGCGHYEHGDGSTGSSSGQPKKGSRQMSQGLLAGEAVALPSRKLTEATARKWGYLAAQDRDGNWCQAANYLDDEGRVVAQKVRFPGKKFTILGNLKAALPLYGQWLWRDKGKMVVVTEGEVDALSLSQVWEHKWPVVSVPNGAQGAAKAVGAALEWLGRFDTVVFAFDMDEPGQKAARECAELLSPGKAKIARLPAKDANECLVQGKVRELIDAIWSAREFRPDGIVQGADLWDALITPEEVELFPTPWTGWNGVLMGLRPNELLMLTAGTGVGKSTVARELAYALIRGDQRVGMVMLEEPVKRTALDLMGLHLNRRLRLSREGVSEKNLREAFEATVGSGRCYLYDHFGSSEVENLMNRLRYLAKGCGCQWLILDHLSIVVSGLDDGDERRLIDRTMTMLRTLVNETGVGLIAVCHLKRGEGKSHEEGGQVSLSHLRGSHSIAQLSDTVVALERDQQSANNADRMVVRVLKDRLTGFTGVAGTLAYDRDTGRIVEVSADAGMTADETNPPEEKDF
jgi:twinkle protein